MKSYILLLALVQCIFTVESKWKCKDTQDGCIGFVNMGYCKKGHMYATWMDMNCCASCKKGKPKPRKAGVIKGKEARACLKSANNYRAKHKTTSPLKWNKMLAKKAYAYAKKLMRMAIRNGGRVRLVHDKDNKKPPVNGENLYYRDNSVVGTCGDADKAWYDEINDYSYSTTRSKNGKAIGHFTQMVWRGSTQVGVGIAVAKSPLLGQYGNKITIVVAKYLAPGNFNYYGKRNRDYSRNVHRLKRWGRK